MTIYQKAIKVKKVCENREFCRSENQCPYFRHCSESEILIDLPIDYNLKDIAKAIKEEKWKIK